MQRVKAWQHTLTRHAAEQVSKPGTFACVSDKDLAEWRTALTVRTRLKLSSLIRLLSLP